MLFCLLHPKEAQMQDYHMTSPFLFVALVLVWPVMMLFMGAWKALCVPYSGPEEEPKAEASQ